MTPAKKPDAPTWQDILKAPFDPSVVKWRPGRSVGNGRYQAFAFVDARDVMERLDAAFGPGKWTDNYTVIDERQAVECRISAQAPDGDWASKTDVGYRNDPGRADSKESEEYKSAYSDAFKRAAVKWGIGRDLYDMPNFELPVDPDTKRFTVVPVWVENKGWTVPDASVRSDEPINALVKRKVQNELAAAGFDVVHAKAAVKTATGKDSLNLLTLGDADKLSTALRDAAFLAAIRTFGEDVAA